MILNSTSNDKQNSKTIIANELGSELEIDISFSKILFNLPLNRIDSEVENFKHTFSNYIQNTKYDCNHFLGLLEHFARIRPKHKHIVPKLYETIISLFTTNKADIETEVQNNYEYPLLYIICYPNKKHNKEKETFLKLFSYLENDDIELLISFLSQHPEININ